MTDKKLTQLSPGSAIVDADLFYSAPAAGGQVKQPATALRTYLLGGSGIRTLLTADLDLYVSPSGNDSNTGLTVGSPWLTIQHAFNYVMANIDAANLYNVNINIAAGTYNSGGAALQLVGPIPGSGLGITLTTSGSVAIDANDFAVILSTYTLLNFKGTGTFSFTNSTADGVGIWSDKGAVINQDIPTTLVFGTFVSNSIHCYAPEGGIIHLQGPISTTGSTVGAHLYAYANGSISRGVGNTTTTITGTPAFADAFAVAEQNGNIAIWPTATFTGSITGLKYRVIMNGTIQSFAQTLPGTSNTTNTGGQYA